MAHAQYDTESDMKEPYLETKDGLTVRRWRKTWDGELACNSAFKLGPNYDVLNVQCDVEEIPLPFEGYDTEEYRLKTFSQVGKNYINFFQKFKLHLPNNYQKLVLAYKVAVFKIN